jgi:hypothetical protein
MHINRYLPKTRSTVTWCFAATTKFGDIFYTFYYVKDFFYVHYVWWCEKKFSAVLFTRRFFGSHIASEKIKRTLGRGLYMTNVMKSGSLHTYAYTNQIQSSSILFRNVSHASAWSVNMTRFLNKVYTVRWVHEATMNESRTADGCCCNFGLLIAVFSHVGRGGIRENCLRRTLLYCYCYFFFIFLTLYSGTLRDRHSAGV